MLGHHIASPLPQSLRAEHNKHFLSHMVSAGVAAGCGSGSLRGCRGDVGQGHRPRRLGWDSRVCCQGSSTQGCWQGPQLLASRAIPQGCLSILMTWQLSSPKQVIQEGKGASLRPHGLFDLALEVSHVTVTSGPPTFTVRGMGTTGGRGGGLV